MDRKLSAFEAEMDRKEKKRQEKKAEERKESQQATVEEESKDETPTQADETSPAKSNKSKANSPAKSGKVKADSPEKSGKSKAGSPAKSSKSTGKSPSKSLREKLRLTKISDTFHGAAKALKGLWPAQKNKSKAGTTVSEDGAANPGVTFHDNVFSNSGEPARAYSTGNLPGREGYTPPNESSDIASAVARAGQEKFSRTVTADDPPNTARSGEAFKLGEQASGSPQTAEHPNVENFSFPGPEGQPFKGVQPVEGPRRSSPAFSWDSTSTPPILRDQTVPRDPNPPLLNIEEVRARQEQAAAEFQHPAERLTQLQTEQRASRSGAEPFPGFENVASPSSTDSSSGSEPANEAARTQSHATAGTVSDAGLSPITPTGTGATDGPDAAQLAPSEFRQRLSADNDRLPPKHQEESAEEALNKYGA